ncbi:hypothetical protein WKH57_01565 [Niallia taxi]|uniref:hypothetical protein n=1 Tax=Niallia taxi TaxID=2499688 RepID=UPI00316E69A0
MTYIRLLVDYTAYYSGKSYYEEVFLPINTWSEIENEFKPFVYLHGLDGKHSEVKVEIEIDEVNKEYLSTYTHPTIDGENLFDFVYEFLDEDKYDSSYLMNIQNEVEALCKVEEMTIKFNNNDKDKIVELLREYIIN